MLAAVLVSCHEQELLQAEGNLFLVVFLQSTQHTGSENPPAGTGSDMKGTA